MNYLIYQLFSGVGFCNQLFSLETAIYLANISDRKLILLIKNPLCHCGRASWEYGTFMDFFSKQYMKYLPNGIEVVYGNPSSDYYDIINNTETTITMTYGTSFSQIGFIDKDIFMIYNADMSNSKIKQFLNGRKPVIFDLSTWTHEYIYITESNASRCFSNFLTTTTNYQLMSNICESLTYLHESFYFALKELNYPTNYISIHLRFGDSRWSKDEVDSRCINDTTHLFNTIEKYNTCNNQIVIMADRTDTLFLESIQNKFGGNITNTEDMIRNIDLQTYFSNIRNLNVVMFLLQKYICEKSNVFIGYEGSTVSNHIHYMNYINNKPCVHYVNRDIMYNIFEYSWYTNGIPGGGIGWKLFFSDNIYKNKLKIITLTNDGYKELTDNLLISLKKLGIEKALKIYCIGDESYNYFKKKYVFNEIEQVDNINGDYLKTWVEYKAAQHSDIEGKKQWATITSYKIYAINKELVMGNDVIFIDGDIVFEKDPFKYMLDCLETDTELLIQNDQQDGMTPAMCTGFFWMKSNENTIRITNFDTITRNIDSFQNDQQYLRRFASQMNHKYLDLGLFPNGKYYRDHVNEIEPYIIHFNYDVSEFKIRRMKQFKKWYMDDEVNNIVEIPKLVTSVHTVVKQNNVTTKSICKINDCNSICEFLKMRNIKIRQGYITQVDEHANKLLTHLNSVCDVNNIKNVIEIGFLAGHSAELFLKLNNHVKVTSIDDGALQSVSAGKEYIDLNYPNRHTLIKGNSNIILTNDKFNVSQLKYDIILIDGSFKYDIVKQDIILSKKLAHSDTILIINNVLKNKFWMKYWTEEVSNATAELVSSGFITNLHNIDIDTGRGSVTCKYNNETTAELNTVIKRDNRIVIKCVRTAGFFSNLLGIIYNAYIHIINGVVPYILWQNPKYMGFDDDNIFNYFFEQDNIVIDNIHDKIVIENGYKLSHILEMAKENNISFRQQMSNMYNIVCKVKPEYQAKIENYVIKFNLNNKDGLHIRQTDRFIGGKGLIYAGPNMYTIESYINSKYIRNFYLATDCDDTFSYFKNKFECYSYALIRSHGVIGIHHSNKISPNNKLIAEEAFMEGMLLSKCKNLYRVTSNLTIFSLIVNPTMMYEDLTIVFKNEIISEHKLNDDLYIESFLSK